VDEAFVVVNGKDLNRLEANALDRSRVFKGLRLWWPQRERGVAEEERQFLENGVGNTCALAVGRIHQRRLPQGTCPRIEGRASSMRKAFPH
jgi:hypothetical protein